ncbi:MAG: thioredoxin domain-containing protein [Chloroflexi bacterium]|nr:thioredoxin domain-containing protein [Chloroflexota bacterium]OJV90064.1 MAG: hypothetical protein BGO39_01405 [Chloroflexi bacterium 54-19]
MNRFKLFTLLLILGLIPGFGLAACSDTTSTSAANIATATPTPKTPGQPGSITVKVTPTSSIENTSAGQFQGIPSRATLDTENMTTGDPKAKITLLKYTDFRCPVCKREFDQIEPLIMQQYVNTGKIKFTLVTFPVIDMIEQDSESQLGGQALLCAAEQKRAWDYHNLAYNNFVGKTQGKLTPNFLKGMGQALGLNTADFNRCLDTGKYRQTLIDQTAQARQTGITGTPTFAILYKDNLQLLSGNSYDVVKAALDMVLARAI